MRKDQVYADVNPSSLMNESLAAGFTMISIDFKETGGILRA